MPLSAGTRLGYYDVTALIGEGGMGQVWQATDTQLNRQVALKILPDAFADDPDRLARFQREAQILASLNHPGIAAIYGIEKDEVEGRRALVLELVEGPTLADRIAQGAMPIDDALPIAKQIAEALEAAHEAGVIHRDLKPANIKVREDGTVKVLDFGLAKAFQPDANDTNVSASPTISLRAAATQMVIGTAAYMSPEQASGKVVDKQADVWAFGAVLYEMLTGARPFVGDDVSKTLAHVIAMEPAWSTLPEILPPVLRAFLRACLEKNPKKRIRDIGDVSLAMEGTFETTVGTAPSPTAAQELRIWQRPVAIAVTVLAAVMLTGLAVWNLTRPVPPAPRPLAQFVLQRLACPRFFGMYVVKPNRTSLADRKRDFLPVIRALCSDILHCRARTFERLTDQHDQVVAQSFYAMPAFPALIYRRFKNSFPGALRPETGIVGQAR